jgi:hypothetical protein
MTLIYLKIWYAIIISTIPIAVLLLAVVFPILGIGPLSPKPGLEIGGTVIVYLFALLFFVLGYYWRRIIKDHYFSRGFVGTSTNIISRPFGFGFGIIMAFVMGMMGFTWFSVVPLLLVEGVALVLIFPTRKRWEKWLAEKS